MHPLLIEVDGRVLRFEGDRPVRIGRSIDADVVLPASSVSRAHAELRPSPQGWVLADVGSAGGTFVDGAQVQEQPLRGRVTVQCGPAGPGTTLTVTPESQAAPEMSAASHAPASSGYDATVIAGAPSTPAPGMAYGPAQPPTGPDLLIVAEGREHRFRHPAEITVGRLPECDIVVDDPAASRRHARVVAQPGGWSFENHSQAGSFVNGRPVRQMAFDEKTEVRLGHPVAGEKLELVPILSAQEEVRRFAARRRKRHLKQAGLVAAALVLFGGVLTAVLLGGESEADSLAKLTAEERAVAMSSTVLLSFEVEVAGRTGHITGSGSIIDGTGLILTNAHVADPNADGLEEIYGPSDFEIPDPDYIEVRLTDPDDSFRTGDIDYRAKVVTSDGSLDAAVIQIYADGDGDEVDPDELDLPVMPLGDSDELGQGDPISVLGFPGIARSRDTDGALNGLSLSATSGVISTIINTERLGERSEFDTDARIAGGNSGGAAIDNDGRLIGVPSAISGDGRTPVVSGRIRPLALLLDMIEKAEQEAR